MYYAMIGIYSDDTEKYVVHTCSSDDAGEEACMEELIDNTAGNRELVYYTSINGMPDELSDKYDPYGCYTFVDGALMDASNDDKYVYVEHL